MCTHSPRAQGAHAQGVNAQGADAQGADAQGVKDCTTDDPASQSQSLLQGEKKNPGNPPDTVVKLDYVYHLNVHHIAANHLKGLLDYDYEDEKHAHVLVKRDVVKHAQTHKTNVYKTLLNGYNIFDLSSVRGCSFVLTEWTNHWMILPKQPYPTSEDA